MRKIALLLLLTFALGLPGCSRSFGSRDDAGGKIRVGIVFDIGGKDDKSFNAAAWEGVKRAKQDMPIQLRDVEPELVVGPGASELDEAIRAVHRVAGVAQRAVDFRAAAQLVVRIACIVA